AGITGEQIEPERDQREDTGQGQDVEPVSIQDKGCGAGCGNAQSEQHSARAEGRGVAVRPRDVSRGAHTLRALTRPKTPSGRTISTAMMMMKVMASPKAGE